MTVSSILSSYDDFARVRRGYYELIAKDEESAEAVTGSARAAGDEVPERAGSVRESGAESRAEAVERDPEEVLAGLQAAAASAEVSSGESTEASPESPDTRRVDSEGRQARRRADRMIRLEPSEAAG